MGFVIVMKLFMFATIMILGWVSLMPGLFWNRLGISGESGDAWQRRLGRLSAWLPESGSRLPVLERWPLAAQRFAFFCLLFVCCWNIRGVLPSFIRVFPAKVNAFALTLRIDQHFAMFAPTPVSEDGWYVVPGRLVNGRSVDVYRDGAPLSWERPKLISDHYINRRWRIYLWGITRTDRAAYRKYYAAYLCRQWDILHEELLEGFDIILMHEQSKPDYTVTQPKPLMLLEGYKGQ